MAWGTAGVWMCEESLGSAGTSGLGFSGGCWAPDGAGVLAHGFTGALHLWRRAGAGGPWRSARP
jgi:elongator complex protein 2